MAPSLGVRILRAIYGDRFFVDRLFVNYGIGYHGGLSLPDSQATSAPPVNLLALGKLLIKPKLLWFLLLVLFISIPHG